GPHPAGRIGDPTLALSPGGGAARGGAVAGLTFDYRWPMPTSPPSVTLGLIQTRCTVDPEHNFRQAIAGVREASAKGAQMLCLLELFRSQYFCQSEAHRLFELAESIPGHSTEALSRIASELGVV